eukprot:TRINITY_DN48027_c0_g1_i1.p1 TRINITY_DN48027_c0_g1~~TRINITY_DN48027_c0_g1_i1.p1  ORF type:complete len:169 (+),score=8.56 TRINITY_DN48027_c0_g1_i1:94-600(+)
MDRRPGEIVKLSTDSAKTAPTVPQWFAKGGPLTHKEAPVPVPKNLLPSTYRDNAVRSVARLELSLINASPNRRAWYLLVAVAGGCVLVEAFLAFYLHMPSRGQLKRDLAEMSSNLGVPVGSEGRHQVGALSSFLDERLRAFAVLRGQQVAAEANLFPRSRPDAPAEVR